MQEPGEQCKKHHVEVTESEQYEHPTVLISNVFLLLK
jgi:hypothetical protein